jgi:hypothetical protein
MNTNLDSPSIKHLTADLHDALEALPFNVKMFEGNQSDMERAYYLASNRIIFDILDPHVPEGFRRSSAIDKDMAALDHSPYGGSMGLAMDSPPMMTMGYKMYLENICENLNAHIYLNYMGFMFGGQIMKKRYPDTSTLYEFDDIVEKRAYIRERIVEDYNAPFYQQFVHEVKVGFKWHIAISKELHERTEWITVT